MTFWEAKQILNEMSKRREQGLCTFGQAKVLVKHGWPAETLFKDAGPIIDRIAKSGWTLRYPG